MITVVAGGDSFVYGSELSDCRDNRSTSEFGHSIKTFPALLSTDYKYQCVAWPGYGNDSISRTVIAFCEQATTQLAVLVSWTFVGRYEFRFNYDTQQRNSPWYTITPWTINDDVSEEFHNKNFWVEYHQKKAISRAKNTGIHNFAESFYYHVGSSEYWEVYSSLKEVVYLSNYLRVKNIPYLFTCADNSIRYNHTISQPDVVISSLLQQIDWNHWFWFPEGTNPQDTQNPRGFYQWAVENKYRMGTTHPLEEAHQDAAQLMQGKFNEMVKKHLG